MNVTILDSEKGLGGVSFRTLAAIAADKGQEFAEAAQLPREDEESSEAYVERISTRAYRIVTGKALVEDEVAEKARCFIDARRNYLGRTYEILWESFDAPV
jgi:hypothetical protein